MSRNLYKYIQNLEKRVEELELKNRLLENNVDHLETLMRLKDKLPERPFYPNPTIPDDVWYRRATPIWMDTNDSITKSPNVTTQTNGLKEAEYIVDKQLAEAKKNPFVKLMCDSFGL